MVILGFYWRSVGIIERTMETTIRGFVYSLALGFSWFRFGAFGSGV